MKPIRMKIRLLNHRLVSAREELGLTQKDAASQIGVTNSTLSALETLKNDRLGCPLNEIGEWKTTSLLIADFYGFSPEWLWPREVRLVRQNAMVLELGAPDVAALANQTPFDLLSEKEEVSHALTAVAKLLPNHRNVIEWRCGFHTRGLRTNEEPTLDGIGQKLQLSRERVRTIQEEGLGHLRKNMPSEGVNPPWLRKAK